MLLGPVAFIGLNPLNGGADMEFSVNKRSSVSYFLKA
jgi:hypothetical protein